MSVPRPIWAWMDNLVKDDGRERPRALLEIVVIGVFMVFGMLAVPVEGLNVVLETADTMRSTEGR